MKKLFNLFMNLRLRTKLFVSFLLIILMSTVSVSFFVIKLYESDLVDRSVNLSRNLVRQLAANVSYKTKSLDDAIFLNVQMAELFNDSGPLTEYMRVVRNASVPLLVDSISNLDVEVDEILLRTATGETYYYNARNPSDDAYAEKPIERYVAERYDEIQDGAGQPVWTSFGEQPDDIFIFRSVIDSSTLRFKGIVGLAIDRAYLKDRYSFADPERDGYIMIYNASRDLIYCSGDILPLAESMRAYRPAEATGAARAEYLRQDGVVYVVGGSVSDDGKWKVLYAIPREGLLKDSSRIRLSILLVCVVSSLFAMLIALGISGGISSNLRKLLDKIRSVGRGDFSTQVEPAYHDEVGELFGEFNVMSSKLDELVDRIAFEQVEKRKAEYNALQAQINPHFLYNALESVNSLAKIHGQDEIVRIIQSLSHLLRVSISGRMSVIPLADEIEYVKDYLSIYRTILGDRIQVDVDVDADTLACMVPKLVLQPIVENAILHGIEGMRTGGLIVISAHRTDHLFIQVSDNGTGMPEETVRRLLEEPQVEDEDREKGGHAHIGIRSVNRRMRILYGDDCGLKITSESGIGTVVELVMPIGREGGTT